MLKKLKGLLSLVICISMLCTVMPITGFAAEGDAASVTFNGNTTNYTTIDAAWAAAVALDTTAENKATIKLLDNCTAKNTLTNTEDYLVLDTNGKTLTTPDAIHNENDVLCGISAEGGSLEITGNGTITGLSRESYARAILLITGGEVYVDGITIHNTGNSASISVLVKGGSFHFLDGYLVSDSEYALDAEGGKVYLYSGKIESTGRLAASFNYISLDVQICYSEKPLYFINNDVTNNKWGLISSMWKVHLADNLIMDLEYSDNPDGSNSTILKSVTEISDTANDKRNYLKIQTHKPSYLFSTSYNSSLLKKIKNDGVTDLTEDAFTAVHFVDLADYDMTNITYSDYSANNDGSVKAWVNGTELYIGGYGKIIAGRSLSCALRDGKKIDSITGLDMFDTSKTTDMGYMFNYCGSESTVFTLDLGDNFDTSKATDMTYMFHSCGENSTKFALNLGDNFDTSNVTEMGQMFYDCGRNSPTFTLDLGDKFDTSKVTYMYRMFEGCGYNSTAFTTLDLSTFNVQTDTNLQRFATNIPVTKFIFGKGWRNATLNMQYSKFANSSSNIQTEIVGATKNVLSYDWASNNRTVTFTDNITYTITPVAEDGGTVSGGGTVLDGESITLTATANDGYTFDGWYDGDTKVCETEEFVIEDAADDKTYTAKFTESLPAESHLFGTNETDTLLSKIKSDGTADVSAESITAVHFVDLADYNLKDIQYSDYSADGDGSVKAWVDGTELYIGGNGKIIAGESLMCAFCGGANINAITGLDMLDTSNVTDMTSMFSGCGYNSTEFTLDLGNNFDTSKVTDMKCMFDACGYNSTVFMLNLGDKFDTSNVTDMSNMFGGCGRSSTVFTLDLGDKFNTAKVTDMCQMFDECGYNSNAFITLDLSSFTLSADTSLSSFAQNMPVTTFIFGEGWANAALPSAGSSDGAFYADSQISTTVTGATPNLINYDWADDNRTVTFTDKTYFTISAEVGTDGGGTVSGGGEVVESGSITLTATANDGYTFDGWYDGDTKVCETEEFVVNNVTADNTYTAKFTKNLPAESYLFSTNEISTLLSKIKNDNVTTYSADAITGVHFVDLAEQDLTDVKYSDYSANGDGSVKAWMKGTELYIGGYGKIIAGESLAYAFYDGKKFDSITGLDMLDTSSVKNMSYMFYSCGVNSTVFTLDLGENFDTLNVTDMSHMFYECGNAVHGVFTLDLGNKFDTSNVTNMKGMFRDCGANSEKFTLDLGGKFDTSNVTDMSYMFYDCGAVYTNFTLNLGDKFNTSNVTDMEAMFLSCGAFSEVFKLVLDDKFNTSNVTNMRMMFKLCGGYGGYDRGYGQPFIIDLGSSFDTSKVTDMSEMFRRCGSTYRSFTLNLGDKFNTSNVTDMSYMFTACAEMSSLDLSKFTLSADTKLDGFARNMDVKTFIFGEGWANATLPQAGSGTGAFYTDSQISTTVTGATTNLINYDWAEDNRAANGLKEGIYIITAKAGTGGTVTGGGEVEKGGSTILNATVNDGYTFDGWYSGRTKVCDTTEFTVSNVTESKIYTAKFTEIVYYTISAKAGTDGGSVTGGGTVAEGSSITLTATADDGYTFDGWYDGNTKVCDTTEFVVTNVTKDKTYTAKFTKIVSRLFSTNDFTTLLNKVETDGITTYKCDQITGVHFVDLANYNLTDIKYSDYSANKDGSVKAWMDGTELYIGGYGTIIAGERLRSAFWHGDAINSITGLEMLDTSNVTDMSFMFYACGQSSNVFTLDFGDTFNTSNVTDMSYMFYYCGYDCEAFTLDMGTGFDTSKVTNMKWMFFRCGDSSKAFTTLDLSTFTVSADTDISNMASQIPVTTFIFGDGWAGAKLPTAGSSTGAFYTTSETDTTIVGATENLINYDWASDNRNIGGSKPKTYTVTATAETGGTVSGGGEVAEGGSIILTATANDGYTFDGWYDGDTKVCDTKEFVVSNVTADKTYTVKFTKNQVDPDPEPEEPDIPYLNWDGSTLSLVKKASASCKVGIVYVGGATFDANNINWDKLVAAGKKYTNLNSSVGYAVYKDFTKRTPGTRGNYVAFVKYTKEDGATTADYITFSVKDAVSFEVPELSYNTKTKTLKMTGSVSSTAGVAYVGDAEFDASNITWNDFIKAGKKYPDINGSGGYEKELNTLDYSKTFDNNGNYIAFIKYFDENLNKSVAKYYTFTVADYVPQPTEAPAATAEDNKIVLTANGFDVAKVTIAYIGTDDMDISNWNEFAAAAAKFSDINGKLLNQQYANPTDGSSWKQKTSGWYAVYIRYIKDGKTCNAYYTAEIN